MSYSDFKHYIKCMQKGFLLDEEEQKEFAEWVLKMEELLEEGDAEDFYGTEGWKHYIGFEEY